MRITSAYFFVILLYDTRCRVEHQMCQTMTRERHACVQCVVPGVFNMSVLCIKICGRADQCELTGFGASFAWAILENIPINIVRMGLSILHMGV